MKLRILYFVLIVGGLLGFSLFIDERWMIPCPLHRITGWECPFCGAQRMIRALFHADWQAALSYNPFLFFSFPLIGIWLFRYWLSDASVWRSPFLSKLCSDRAFFIYLFAALLWGVLRNLYICE